MRGATAASQAHASAQSQAAAASQTAASSASKFGTRIQSAGYQVQDFAVQVAGGQSALVALSQQGSQFLGVFGTGGAIAGAVLTVGILGARLLGVSSNAQKATKEAEGLNKALRDLYLARQEFKFESLKTPQEQSVALITDKTKLDQEISDYGKSIDRINERISKITVSGPGGAFKVRFGKGDEYKELIRQREIFQTIVAKDQKEALDFEKRIQDLKDQTFQKDRENENELISIRINGISAGIQAETRREIVLADFEKKRLEQNRVARDGILGKIPQSLQMNLGTSALGGVAGDGSDAMSVQKQVLTAINALLSEAKATVKIMQDMDRAARQENYA